MQTEDNTPLSKPNLTSSLKKPSQLEKIIGILQKGQRTRSERDLNMLVPLIKAIQFFKERDIKDQDFNDIVSCLTYEYFQQGDCVFQFNTTGEQFYIILEGTVGVLVPNPEVKDAASQIEKVRSQVASKQLQLKEVISKIEIEKQNEQIRLQEADKKRQTLDLSQTGSLSPKKLFSVNQQAFSPEQKYSLNETVSPLEMLRRISVKHESPFPSNKMSSSSLDKRPQNSSDAMAAVYGVNNKSPLGTVYKTAIAAASFGPRKSNLILELNRMDQLSSDSRVDSRNQYSNLTLSKGELGLSASKSRNLGLSGVDDRSSSQNTGVLDQVWGSKSNKVIEMEIEESDDDESKAGSKETSQKKKRKNNIQLNKMKEVLLKNMKNLPLEDQKIILQEQIRKLKESEEQQLLMEVVQLNSGKSFGELALIKNKGRAATIRCITECHFAVMSKADYQKVLQKIEQKNLNKIVDFLAQAPFLQPLTRSALAKLQYSFEQRSFKRNQVVYKERVDQAGYIYLIKSGEFDIEKTVQKSTQKKINITQVLNETGQEVKEANVVNRKKMLNLDEDSEDEDDRSKPKRNKIAMMIGEQQLSTVSKQTFRLACIGKGQIFGEEDVLASREFYTTTVTCKSLQAEVYCIKSAEFHRKIKPMVDSWRIVVIMALAKSKALFDRLRGLQGIMNKGTKVEKDFANQQTALQKLLVNQNEMDLRETFKEIICQYPQVDNHRKFLSETKESKFLQDEKHQEVQLKQISPLPSNQRTLLTEKKQSKPTVELNLSKMKGDLRNLGVYSLHEDRESKSNNSKETSGMQTPQKQVSKSQNRCYISSKIADALQQFNNSLNLSAGEKTYKNPVPEYQSGFKSQIVIQRAETQVQRRGNSIQLSSLGIIQSSFNQFPTQVNQPDKSLLQSDLLTNQRLSNNTVQIMNNRKLSHQKNISIILNQLNKSNQLNQSSEAYKKLQATQNSIDIRETRANSNALNLTSELPYSQMQLNSTNEQGVLEESGCRLNRSRIDSDNQPYEMFKQSLVDSRNFQNSSQRVQQKQHLNISQRKLAPKFGHHKKSQGVFQSFGSTTRATISKKNESCDMSALPPLNSYKDQYVTESFSIHQVKQMNKQGKKHHSISVRKSAQALKDGKSGITEVAHTFNLQSMLQDIPENPLNSSYLPSQTLTRSNFQGGGTIMSYNEPLQIQPIGLYRNTNNKSISLNKRSDAGTSTSHAIQTLSQGGNVEAPQYGQGVQVSLPHANQTNTSNSTQGAHYSNITSTNQRSDERSQIRINRQQ